MTDDQMQKAFERACILAQALRSMTNDLKTAFVTELIDEASVVYAVWQTEAETFRVEIIKGAPLVGMLLTTYVPVADQAMADFLRSTLGDGRGSLQ